MHAHGVVEQHEPQRVVAQFDRAAHPPHDDRRQQPRTADDHLVDERQRAVVSREPEPREESRRKSLDQRLVDGEFNLGFGSDGHFESRGA